MIKHLSILFVLATLVISSCSHSFSSDNNVLSDDNGNLNISITLGKIPGAQKRAIELCSLFVDIIPFSGDTIKLKNLVQPGEIVLDSIYELPIGLTKIVVMTKDQRDTVVHFKGDSIQIISGQIAELEIKVASRFSQLKVTIPEIDPNLNVSKKEVIISGNVMFFETGSQIFEFDYLRAMNLSPIFPFNIIDSSVNHLVRVKIYSSKWGGNTLIYEGEAVIKAEPGKNISTNLNLLWVGPNDLSGYGNLKIILGSIGQNDINGIVHNPANLFVSMDNNLIDDRYVVGGETALLGKFKFVPTNKIQIKGIKVKLEPEGAPANYILEKINIRDAAGNILTSRAVTGDEFEIYFNLNIETLTHLYLEGVFNRIGKYQVGETDTKIKIRVTGVEAIGDAYQMTLQSAFSKAGFSGFSKIFWDSNGDGDFTTDDTKFETTSGKEVAVLTISNWYIGLVESHEGYNVDDMLTTGWNNVGILLIKTSASDNTYPNGEAVEMFIESLRPKIEKSVGTKIQSVSIERIGSGFSGNSSLGFSDPTDTLYYPTDLTVLGNDIKSGPETTFAFLIKTNVESLNPDIPDWIRFRLDDLHGSSVNWRDGEESQLKNNLRLGVNALAAKVIVEPF